MCDVPGLFCGTCLDQLVHLAFVELELTRLVLCEVGKVERYPHKVTLGSIIALIVVIIDDHIVAIIFRSRHILEVV